MKNTRPFQLFSHTPRYLCLPLWPRKPSLPGSPVPTCLQGWSRVPGVQFDGAKLFSTSSQPCRASCLSQPGTALPELGTPGLPESLWDCLHSLFPKHRPFHHPANSQLWSQMRVVPLLQQRECVMKVSADP